MTPDHKFYNEEEDWPHPSTSRWKNSRLGPGKMLVKVTTADHRPLFAVLKLDQEVKGFGRLVIPLIRNVTPGQAEKADLLDKLAARNSSVFINSENSRPEALMSLEMELGVAKAGFVAEVAETDLGSGLTITREKPAQGVEDWRAHVLDDEEDRDALSAQGFSMTFTRSMRNNLWVEPAIIKDEFPVV